MPNLSIIVAGRNDNYGENMVERFSLCMKKMSAAFPDEEIIVVDWNPIDSYLWWKFPWLNKKPFNNIIVENKAIVNNGFNASGFNEFFAKNVGIRHATGDWIC